MPEVVVTGIGLVAGRCISPEALFDFIAGGGSLVRRHPLFEQCGFPNPACAFLDRSVWELVEQTWSSGDHLPGPAASIALYTASQAWDSAGLPRLKSSDGVRAGAFVACNKKIMEAGVLERMAECYDTATGKFDLDRYISHGDHQGVHYFHRIQDFPSLMLAHEFGIRGRVMTHGDACAAGGDGDWQWLSTHSARDS